MPYTPLTLAQGNACGLVTLILHRIREKKVNYRVRYASMMAIALTVAAFTGSLVAPWSD